MNRKGWYVDRGFELIIGDYQNDPDNAVLLDNVQITFDINKSASNKDRTNSAAIEIYNLDKDTLALLDRDYIAASFSAGYYNTEIKRIFAGDVNSVITRREGTDLVTQIQMGAGYVTLNQQILSELTAPGRTVKDVLETIRTRLKGVNRGIYTGTNINSQVLNGYPLVGTPKQIIDKLSQTYGIEISVDNDVMRVVDSGSSFTKSESQALVISPDTGLHGLAYRTTGDKLRTKLDKAKLPGMQFQSYLNADLIPGAMIKLEQGDNLDGYWRIDSVRFTGSWRKGDWISDVHCTQKIT